MSKMTDKGLRMLKSFESCKLDAYQDSVGVWTIGWGQTGPGVVEGVYWTQQECDDALNKTLEDVYKSVMQATTRSLNDDELSALMDFVYNLGINSFKQSTLRKFINMGNFEGAPTEFKKWVYAGDNKLQGLVDRRDAEAALFSSDYDTFEEILSKRGG